MNIKKLISLLIVVAICCGSFAACSANKKETAVTTTKVVEVKDADDDVKMTVSDESETTLEVKDNQGNVLTIVPVYNTDGKTMIAGYVEKAADKNGKNLDEKSYAYLKAVIAMSMNSQGQGVIKYTSDKKFVTLEAECDEKGYIVAIQDSIDVDGDKDTKEYFKVVTKLDTNSNLFIKLDKDEKGNLINVEVKKDNKGNAVVTDETGKKQTVVNSQKSVNLVEIVKEDKEKKKAQASSSTSSSTNQNSSSSGAGSSNSGTGNLGSGTGSTGSGVGNTGSGTGSSGSGTGNSGTGTGNSGSGAGNSSSGTGNSGSGSNSGTGSGSNSGSSSSESTGNQQTVDYTSIVLMDNGKVACDADNVTINEASALNGGTEVIVNGGGTHNKYYVTSQTSVFTGQIEFRFSIDEAVEVKVYNVDISTSKKTAIKFTNVDSESEKENDTEEVAGDNSQSGSSAITYAPDVEFSITGSNSFEAAGSGKNGTIYSECKLAIKGHGSATIDGGENLSGICSTESIDIKNATLNITSKAKQGISCDKKVTVKGGATINIESKGDGIHCNKFETDPLAAGETDSVINIKSLSDVQGADGIDANDYIIIESGKINAVSLTAQKYGLKVRNVNEGKSNGYFEINGGTVTAVGSLNSNLTKCSQKTLWAKSRQNTIFTVGSVASSNANKAFICSPVKADSVTNSKGSQREIRWAGNIGTVSF